MEKQIPSPQRKTTAPHAHDWNCSCFLLERSGCLSVRCPARLPPCWHCYCHQPVGAVPTAELPGKEPSMPLSGTLWPHPHPRGVPPRGAENRADSLHDAGQGERPEPWPRAHSAHCLPAPPERSARMRLTDQGPKQARTCAQGHVYHTQPRNTRQKEKMSFWTLTGFPDDLPLLVWRLFPPQGCSVESFPRRGISFPAF